MKYIDQFIENFGANYRIYSLDQLLDLFSTRNHPDYISKHRGLLIIERVHFFAAIFAILMTLWLIIDYLVFPIELFMPIAFIRFISALLFAYLSWPHNVEKPLSSYRISLALFLLNLPATFLGSAYFLAGIPLDSSSQILVKIYALLPYMSVAGLALFPLTLLETLAFSIPLSLVSIGGWALFGNTSIIDLIPSVWLLLILLVIVLFSATNQLLYMISLVSRTSYDPVTGALTHRSGLDALVREFQMTLMHNDNFAVALIDLDNIEKIIRKYDYDAYDHVILEAARMLQGGLRHNDILVRWGEKVFLLIMPNTSSKGVAVTLGRIQTKGVSSLPDGKPVTASIGVAERLTDSVNDWHDLIDLVDKRRDEAKLMGKDQIVSFDGPTTT